MRVVRIRKSRIILIIQRQYFSRCLCRFGQRFIWSCGRDIVRKLHIGKSCFSILDESNTIGRIEVKINIRINIIKNITDSIQIKQRNRHVSVQHFLNVHCNFFSYYY